MALVMSMGITAAFATSITITSTADTNEAKTETTAYKAWKLLDAEIEDASKITVNPTTGASTAPAEGADAPKVAYYTTSEAAKNALTATGLFTFVYNESNGRWYATAEDSFTDANTLITKLTESYNGDVEAMEAGLTTIFGNPTEFAQQSPGGTATSGDVAPGYYFIDSTLGDKIAVQTLADVTINTKNSYPTDEKELTTPDSGANAQIGDEVSYTLTVNIPASANDKIVLTDTMDEGLTFSEIDNTFSSDVAYTSDPATLSADSVTTNGNKFSLTISADDVKAHQGSELTIVVKALINEKAKVGTPIKNKLDLKYGNNYEAKPKEVETETHSFTFDKIDGSDSSTKLTGAEFQLLDGTTPVTLVVVTEGEEYRVATEAEAADDAVETTDTIVTKGKTITIKGVDSDSDHSYKLHETKAPAGGYNLLTEDKEVTVDAANTTHVDVENNKGTVLPSTGGIGTTIFYVVGSILVVAAGVLLITKKRMSREG